MIYKAPKSQKESGRKGGPPNEGAKEGQPSEEDVILPLLHSQGGATQLTWYAITVNKMSNLIDFKHLQTVLLAVAYARITTFSLIAGRYYDDKIINVKTPKFCRT